MEKEKIDRINELARKAKEAPLTNEEADEQNRLRQEYLDEIRISFGATLAHTVIQFHTPCIEFYAEFSFP